MEVAKKVAENISPCTSWIFWLVCHSLFFETFFFFLWGKLIMISSVVIDIESQYVEEGG